MRDQDRREVDFLTTKDLLPQCVIEAKKSPQDWTASLNYYCEKLKIPGFLVYPNGPTKKHWRGYSMGAAVFLKKLI
ncbi:MAG: hypothetical protein QE271_07055 [Bacteriovoracaceae bacterium]|nr:hypothetical protein [Bacteriovoracaceae bacterium]